MGFTYVAFWYEGIVIAYTLNSLAMLQTAEKLMTSDVIKRMHELNNIPCRKSTFYRHYHTKTTKKSPQSTQSGVLEEGHDMLMLMNLLWQALSMI
jgi:hypothetical protein